MKKHLLLFLVINLMLVPGLLASHIQGGNITYQCLGGNQYRITLTMFEDCGTGYTGTGSMTVQIANTCGLGPSSVVLTNSVYQQEVSQLCPSQLPMSECNSGGLPGVWMHQWTGVVTLGGPCPSWTFSYGTCCWNASNNSSSSAGQYFNTTLNNTTGGCDASPVVTGQPIPYLCAGQTSTYSLGATDANGNNVTYAIVPADVSATTTAPYSAGYSGTSPIPGITIDPSTGLITVTPTITGNYIMAVDITSYNAAGQVIGVIHHQFQIVVINCSNSAPVPPAGGLTNVTAGATLNSPNSVTFCRGQNGCFDVTFTDANAGNTIALTSNITAAMPGATISITGTNPATATVCWNPTAASPSNSTLALTAEDNACPITGVNSYNVDINVITCCLPPTVSATPTCAGSNNGTVTAQGNGVANYTYGWVNTATGAIVGTHTGIAGPSTITNLPAGTYQVTVTDATGCTTTGTVTVVSNPVPTVAVNSSTICSGTAASVTATPSLPGGTFLWNTTETTGTITPSPMVTTNYSVTYTLAGCTATASGTVTVNPTPTITTNNPTICTGQTANITSNPSIPGGSFSWTGGLPATQNVSISPAASTSYTVTYTLAGCTATATSNVTVNPVPTVTVNDITVCAGSSATLTATPDIAGGAFTWSTSATTASITETPATTTTYTVDYVLTGCSALTASGTITVTPNPVANFSPTMVCEGTATQFTDLSTAGVSSWVYDFDDGTPVDNNQNPVHNYANDGIYNVSLTVVSSGCTGTITLPVTVNPMPVASYTIAPACPTSNTLFDATASAISGGTIVSYDWTLGGSSAPASTGTNPSVTYAAGGLYPSTLIITSDQGCSDTLTQTVDIPYMPVPDFAFNDECFTNQNCFTDLSTVTDATITSWTWVWGDGLPVGTTQNPCHLYGTPGAYTVTLIPTTSEGCTGPSVAHVVNVNSLPVAGFNLANVCQLTAAQFTNTSTNAATYNWNFGDFQTSTSQDPAHNYGTHNTYNVQLIAYTTEGCSDTITQSITVYPEPNALYNFTSVCEDNMTGVTSTSTVGGTATIVSTSWDMGDGNTTTGTALNHQYAADGNYNVMMVVTTSDGCSDSIMHVIPVYPLPSVSFTPTDVCLNTQTMYNNLSTIPSGAIAAYNWSFGDGGSSTLTNPTHIYPAIGTYNVVLTATSDHGCITIDTIPVSVHDNPAVTFSADMLASCSPLCVSITDASTISTDSISSFSWNMGDGTNATGANVAHCYTNNTLSNQDFTITLTATSTFGCATTVAYNNYLTVYPTPVADFVHSPQPVNILEPDVLFTNTTLGGDIYSWTFGDGHSSTANDPTNTYAEPGIYEVVLTATSNQGCIDTVHHFVEVQAEFLFYVPNTFTPDGDGINDLFMPFVQGYEVKEFEWYVFNRWGEVIFESHFADVPWDGMVKGNTRAKTDTYVWKIRLRDKVSNEKKEYFGHVNVLY